MAPSSRYYEEKRRREEERRQRELERRKEEAAERQRAEERERLREEERREEARREALEFEAALERARTKREETLARLRLQKRLERRESEREMKRRDNLLAALREANRDREREEARKESAKERYAQGRETAASDSQKKIAQEQKKDGARKEVRDLEERRRTSLEEARKKASAPKRKGSERLDKEQVQKKQPQQTAREELAKERLKERKREEAESETEEKRRADLIKKRARELSSAQRAEERRALALAARKEEQERDAKEAERREQARRERMQEQKQERERIEKEEERRKEQAKERRTQEKEGLARSPRETGLTERPAPPKPLDSRLPSGVLSGRLPWLLTYDNRIVTTEGEVVFLRGVNLPPLDVFESTEHTLEEALSEILSWGANVIRLGVSHNRIIGGESASLRAYLELLDRVVAQASERNCYTIVHPLDGPAGAPADTPYLWSLSCHDVTTTLRVLAERYASEPAVLLDLGYPPRDLLEGQTPSRQAAWSAWNGLIPNLVADLRERHPRVFCFAGGLDKGADISGFPVAGQIGRPIPGLAYSASIRPGGTDPWAQIRRLTPNHPLFVSEWGATTTDTALSTAWEAASGERVAVMLETLSVGWAAAFWDGLVRPAPHGKVLLTPFGAVVKRVLTRANARAELSQLTRFSLTM